MKVRIYVQPDRKTALVVPINSVNKPLPPAQASMRDAAIKTFDADLGDSIIGIDRNGAHQGILKDGFYVNNAHVQMDEQA